MGYLAVGLIVVVVGWFLFVMVRNAFTRGTRDQDPEWEQVDILEAGAVVEQQKYGRERNRRVEVQIPNRPLCFEEELNLRSILESNNQNVRIK